MSSSYIILILIGYEASAHLAEETGDSATAASNGLINTVFATGFGGLFLILGLLFAYEPSTLEIITDDYNPDSPATGNAAVNLFILATGTRYGIFLAWLIVVNLFFAGE